MAGTEGDVPVVAPLKTIARRFFLEPGIAQQNAHGFFLRGTEPVKNYARLRLAKLVVGDFQRVVIRRRELGLEPEAETARHGVRALDAEVFGKNPQRLRGQAVARQTAPARRSRLRPTAGG